MRRTALATVLLLLVVPAFGQNNRTFISTTGVDTGSGVGACGGTNPCRYINYALANTNTGGDIVVLTSGGYGPSVTINKAVNVIVPPGTYASLTPSSAGATALTIAATSSDVVRIDGLSILGTGPVNGQKGIEVGVCKRAELAKLVIRNVANGIHIGQDVRVTITDTYISNVDNGVYSQGTGDPASPSLKVYVSSTQVISCIRGFKADTGNFTLENNQYGDTPSRVLYATGGGHQFGLKVSGCSSGNSYVTMYNNSSANDTRDYTNTTTCDAP